MTPSSHSGLNHTGPAGSCDACLEMFGAFFLTPQGYALPRPHPSFPLLAVPPPPPSSLPPVPDGSGRMELKPRSWTVVYLRGQSGSINGEVKRLMNSILTRGQRLQVKMSTFNWSRSNREWWRDSMKSLMKTTGIYRQAN